MRCSLDPPANFTFRRRAASGAIASALLLLAACASAPKPPPPTQVDGRLEATATVNPSVSARPSPLLVRVYELKTAAGFNAADFMSLYQRDAPDIAADVITKEDVVLQPGEAKPMVKTLAPETRFIGVVAAYRDVEHAVWRASVPVQPHKKNKLVIKADALTVTASVGP